MLAKLCDAYGMARKRPSMGIKHGAVTCFFVAFLALPALSSGARAASAVAASVDNFGYCYDMPNAKAAADCAVRSCAKRSRQSCRVITACGARGYGAIFLRLLPGRTIEAIGASCGAASKGEAFRQAAKRCNKLAKSNTCRGPHGAWVDGAR